MQAPPAAQTFKQTRNAEEKDPGHIDREVIMF